MLFYLKNLKAIVEVTNPILNISEENNAFWHYILILCRYL
jgi:hypothetical protein